MALIDKASLLMVPSTYEAGKLYNVLPSGNRAPDSTDQNSGYDQTRADFDFDRGSNAAATRVNASGLIEKYRENLLLNSNQFDTTWTNASTTEASGFEGYDGTNDAWKLTKSAASGRIQQSTFSAGVYSFSVYVKANTNNWVQLYLDTTTPNDPNAFFDLQNGLVGTTSDNIDASIQSIGNGWYRCSVVGSVTTTFVAMIFPAEADNDKSATTGSIFIQSAQLESGLVATDYLDSTSVTAKAGVLVDLPRINYDANGENGSLLLEPSRANLYAQSEYLDSWSKQSVTIETNAVTSPEGLVNASKVIPTASNAFHAMYYSTTTSTSYVVSVFAKAAGYNFLRIYDQFSSGVTPASFDLVNGTTNGGNIEDYGNGWYRCTAYGVNPSASTNIPSFTPSPDGTNVVFTGDGTSGVYLFGAQFEASATYASSYIPTMGTSETRAADSCSVTGASDVIGQTEGTLYFEGSVKSDGANVVFFEIVNGTDSSNTMTLYINNSNNNLEMYNPDAGPNVNILKDGNNQGVDFKLALAYQSNDYVCYVNGVQTYIDNSANVPISMNGVYIGQNRNGVEKGLTIAKQAVLFKERLSNAELAALTA